MNKQQQNNILHTVAYFNSMKYPLTVFELWRYYIDKDSRKKTSYLEVLNELGSEVLRNKVRINKGFLTLKGSDESLVEKRLHNQKMSLVSIKKLKRWSRLFRIIPFVRGVFVTGTLAMKNARRESDWDIMLVCARDRIWIGRLFVGLTLQIFGKRRHGEKVKKRFCLNHYITDNGLILQEHSIYCSYFTTFSFPVVGGKLHKKFLQLNEHWVNTISPNYMKDELTETDIFNIHSQCSWFQKVVEAILEKTNLASMINKFSKKIMVEKIQQNPKTHQKNADIRYDDYALIFLPNPHRIEIAQETKRKLTKGF